MFLTPGSRSRASFKGAFLRAFNLSSTQQVQVRTNIGWPAALPAIANLNSITAAGFYYSVDSSSSNSPTDQFIYLLVESFLANPGYCKQTVTALTGGTASTWVRTMESSVWGAWHKAIFADRPSDFGGMTNGTLVASAAAGALTVAVKTLLGADPSPGDPVYFYFRNNTLTAGDYVSIAVTSALSVVLGSTKTLGSGLFPRLYISAHNNAGTVQLGAFIASDSTGIFCPSESVKYTTTVPDNTAKVFHTTSAIATAAPWRLIGECEWFTTQTPGTWTAPSVVQLFTAGMKRPGDLVQSSFSSTTAGATGVTLIPFDNTIPQNTEGNQYMSLAVTPQSAANRFRVTVNALTSNSTASSWDTIALFQDSGVNALAAMSTFENTGTGGGPTMLRYETQCNLAVSTTFAVRAGSQVAGTTTFNGNGGSQIFGGVCNSSITVEELKG